MYILSSIQLSVSNNRSINERCWREEKTLLSEYFMTQANWRMIIRFQRQEQIVRTKRTRMKKKTRITRGHEFITLNMTIVNDFVVNSMQRRRQFYLQIFSVDNLCSCIASISVPCTLLMFTFCSRSVSFPFRSMCH